MLGSLSDVLVYTTAAALGALAGMVTAVVILGALLVCLAA